MRAFITFTATMALGSVCAAVVGAAGAGAAGAGSVASFILGMTYMLAAALVVNGREAAR